MPVTYLKGVGPRRAESLRRLGIVTARDLLYHIPHRYEDASTIRPISSLEPGMDATVIGRVVSKGIIPTRRGLRIFQAVVRDDSGVIEASWPGQPFLDRSIAKDDVLRLAKIPALPDALRMVHRPASIAEAEMGRSRLAYEELLFVHLVHRRANALARERRKGIAFENKRDLTTSLKSNLPFTLTQAQNVAIREIFADMCSPQKMHRLLQGDVGSGKTIVGLFAALLAMENGYQAALMAPTELLAEQHFRTITRLLAPLSIKPVLLTGSMTTRERAKAGKAIASKSPALVIGTHALIQEGTTFGKLGLAIIDEQHRFGVEHRAAMAGKGEAPDILLMSATPIPRSLALTMYGDLDVSTLDERPAGRQPVTTVMRPEKVRDKVLEFVRRETDEGRQVYIVYPVIEESEKLDLKAATTMYQRLSEGPFAGKRVALIHGRVPTLE